MGQASSSSTWQSVTRRQRKGLRVSTPVTRNNDGSVLDVNSLTDVFGKTVGSEDESSAALSGMFGEGDSVGTEEPVLDGGEIYFDAIDRLERFPLTTSEQHKFVEAEICERIITENVELAKTDLSNSYSQPHASVFSVRGPEYLGKVGKNMKELKVPSEETPYEVIGVNMFHSERRIKHASKDIVVLRKHFEDHPADSPEAVLPTFLVINWLMSPLFGRECWVVNHVYRLKETYSSDAPLESAFRRFTAGTDSQKNAQFKYMFRVGDAPGPLRSAISSLGGERPVIIGKSLTTTYNRGANYLEVNMDVSSSRIASAINGLILKNMESIVCDCAWLLEGQREEELPERLLATIRWNWNCVENVVVNLDASGERM